MYKIKDLFDKIDKKLILFYIYNLSHPMTFLIGGTPNKKNKNNKMNKKNKKNKKNEVDQRKIDSQVQQYHQEQCQERELLLSSIKQKSFRLQLHNDYTLEPGKLTKPKGIRNPGSSKDIYTKHARQRLKERGSRGTRIRSPDDHRIIITVLPENQEQEALRIQREEQRRVREQGDLERFLQLNNR